MTSFNEDKNDYNTEFESDWDITSVEYNDMENEDRLAYLGDIFNPTSSGFCYNGVTKRAYPFKKSHPDAKKLFVVHDSKGSWGRTDPYKIYYDTPEQYSRHRKIKLQPGVIESFYNRQRLLVESKNEQS